MSKHYGYKFRVLHWCTDQSMTNALAQMDLTSAQGHILAYLSHQPSPPCPKDIEEAFHLSHPTVSGLLGRMEKKGFIALRMDEKDKRSKRVDILPKGQECLERMHQTILENEKKIVQGFTEAEQEQFSAFLERAIANMGGGPCKRKHKEDSQI